jgi:pilus assembly protein Flp/PilA
MKTFLKSFFRNESGASAAEYALILAIVGVALGAAALYLSVQVSGAINNAGNEVAAGCPDGDCGAITPTAATTEPPAAGGN